MSRLFFLIIFFTSTHLNAIEFKGKFLQGHYIVGITDPSAKITIDKKQIKVTKDGYFVFGIGRDRKFDVTITKIVNGESKKIIKKVLKRKYNIRVNTVCPTFVVTPMTKKFLKNKKFKRETLNNIPLGRFAELSEISSAVVFLASDAASMITGTSLLVDGGWTAK